MLVCLCYIFAKILFCDIFLLRFLFISMFLTLTYSSFRAIRTKKFFCFKNSRSCLIYIGRVPTSYSMQFSLWRSRNPQVASNVGLRQGILGAKRIAHHAAAHVHFIDFFCFYFILWVFFYRLCVRIQLTHTLWLSATRRVWQCTACWWWWCRAWWYKMVWRVEWYKTTPFACRSEYIPRVRTERWVHYIHYTRYYKHGRRIAKLDSSRPQYQVYNNSL